MSTAEKWIKESPAIGEAKAQLNKDYLNNLSIGSEKLTGEISIGRSIDLKGILEKLELSDEGYFLSCVRDEKWLFDCWRKTGKAWN